MIGIPESNNTTRYSDFRGVAPEKQKKCQSMSIAAPLLTPTEPHLPNFGVFTLPSSQNTEVAEVNQLVTSHGRSNIQEEEDSITKDRRALKDSPNSQNDASKLKPPYWVQLKGEGKIAAKASSKRNRTTNTRYSFFTFVPFVLLDQFSDFQNAFYLIVATSQFIPLLQIGPRFTYIVPLLFVITMSLLRESLDELHRWVMDRRKDREPCSVLEFIEGVGSTHKTSLLLEATSYRSADMKALHFGDQGSARVVKTTRESIRVGDMIYLPTGARVPADAIVLTMCDRRSRTYIRTDELDGERNWKVRKEWE